MHVCYTLNSKPGLWLWSGQTHQGPVQHRAAHEHSALFQWAQSLNYRAKVKTGSPEYAYLPRSLEDAGEHSKLTINHRPHGTGPWAPACHIAPINTNSIAVSEQAETSRLQSAVSNDFSLDFLIYISMLACHLKGITFAISGQQADVYGNGPTLAGVCQLLCGVVLKQTRLLTYTLMNSLLMLTAFQELSHPECSSCCAGFEVGLVPFSC